MAPNTRRHNMGRTVWNWCCSALLRAAGARPARIMGPWRPLCARQPPNRLRAGAARQSGGAVREGVCMFAEGGSPQPTLSWRPPTGVGTGGTGCL